MADFSAIKTEIQTNIDTNGNQEITGAVLQETLIDMVDATEDSITALESEVGSLIGWNSMPEFAGQLGNTAITETEADISSFKVIKVSPNDVVTLRAGNEAGFIAILKSIDFSDLSALDFATGYDNRISITAREKWVATMPSDANYIVVACNWNSIDRSPTDIKINGYSIYTYSLNYLHYALNDNKLQDITIGTLEGWDSMPKYAGQLGNTSVNEADINVSYNKILKIAPNDDVLIKANAEGSAFIAILKSIDFADLSQLDFATGYDNRISINAATSGKFTMPNDANYIIVACLWAGQDRTPNDILINGESIIYKEKYVTEKKFSAIYLGTEKRHVLQSIVWGNGTISSDGTEGDSATFIKTDFIDVSGVDLLRIDINQDDELFTTIGLYDKNKQFIKRLNTRVSAQFQFNGNLKNDAGCQYVKISSNTTDIALLTISVDVLPSRYYNRRLLSNQNIKSFSHAGSSLMRAVTAGNNLPSSMWGTYLNGFDVIHCNVRYTTDNIGYCLHDETFVDEVSGNTIVLGDVSSEVIEACRIEGQPLAKVESVIYLAKMMGLDVCLYNIYGRLDSSVISDIIRMAKTYGMFEHIYFGIPYSDVGLQYLDAIYAEYPKAKILLTQPSIPIIEYAQITEVLARANNVLSTRPELEVYLWINSGYDTASYERLNLEKPYKVKVGCYQVTKEQEPIVLPYIDIYTSANGLRSFGIARRDVEVAVTNKYPEFLMGDFGNIV